MAWYERVRVIVAAYYMAAKYLICELLGRKIGIYQGLENTKFPRQDGRYAIVTGGSRGIGFEIVNNLLESGYNVVIGSSSSEVNRNVLEQTFKRKYENSSVEVWHLDLVSLKSVKAFVEKYLSTGRPLHLLINNAGIMFVKEEYTEDGFEKHFAVNYVSHCLLTILLLPLLAKSGTANRYSRIINSTSCIHYVGYKDSKHLQKKAYYSKYGAYIQSKLAQVMFTYSLQAHLSVENIYVTVNCVHPGVVNTELMSSVLWISIVGSIGSFFLRIFLKSAKQGAETATFAALSPEMEGIGGKYLEECRPVPSSKISQDRVLQNDLWIETWDSLKDWIPKGNAFSHSFFPISK